MELLLRMQFVNYLTLKLDYYYFCFFFVVKILWVLKCDIVCE